MTATRSFLTLQYLIYFRWIRISEQNSIYAVDTDALVASPGQPQIWSRDKIAWEPCHYDMIPSFFSIYGNASCLYNRNPYTWKHVMYIKIWPWFPSSGMADLNCCVFNWSLIQCWIWNTITYLHFLETGKRWLLLRPASSTLCGIVMTYGVWEFGHPCFAEEVLSLAEAKPFPRLMIVKLTIRNKVWIKIKNISLVEENALGNAVYEILAFCSSLKLVILSLTLDQRSAK